MTLKFCGTRLFAPEYWGVATARKAVALTLDDGPEPGATEAILNLLEKRKARATFFLIGSKIDANPALARAIAQAGHQIGNHSYTHPHLVGRSPWFVARELDRTTEAIHAAGFQGPMVFRPPFGDRKWLLPYMLRRRGMPIIGWDVAKESWQVMKPVEALVRETLEAAKPGSVILLHPMQPMQSNSLKALPDIIEGLRARGNALVTVSELLAMEGK